MISKSENVFHKLHSSRIFDIDLVTSILRAIGIIEDAHFYVAILVDNFQARRFLGNSVLEKA